jgi:PTH2 family peptidyl-tRNA hydrolase
MNVSSMLWASISLVLLSYVVYLKMPKRTRRIKVREGDYQVVVVVNRDLHMTKGKVLSQFGHGIDSLHERLEDHPDLVKAWRNSGSAKIALRGTQDDLNRICHDSKSMGLLYVRIFDAGRTQVKPGSNTVIVVGPATKQELEPVTGHLSLY